jgi:hypothetical protein
LRDIDSHFLKYYTGISRKVAFPHKVLLDEESINSLCLTGIKEGELSGDGIAENGYMFGVSTGQREEESSRISFVVGAAFHATGVSNSCVISIPSQGYAGARLLQPEKSQRMLRMLVKTWNPDYAVLTSTELRDTLNLRNEVGWITFRRKMRRIPELGGSLTYERDEKGYWFSVKDIGNLTNGIGNQLLLIKGLCSYKVPEYALPVDIY